jgi:uncharacterized surface anchored protein
VVLDVGRARARRFSAVLAAVVLALCWLVGGLHAQPASAAQINGAITNITLSPASAGPGDPIRVDVDWAVPDSAVAGDTFTLTLPPQLTSLTTTFQLKAPDGSVVAVAQVVNGVVTFTLTDYADTHDSLHGSAFFSVKWDLSTTPTSGPVGLDFGTTTKVFHRTVIKTPGTTTVDRSKPRKAGHWVSPGVTTGPDALEWVIDSPNGPFDRATFHDTLGAGQAIDCATLTFQLGSGLDATGHASGFRPLPAGKVISSACSATGLSLVAGPVQADQLVRIRYSVTITDSSLTSYTNAVNVTVDSTRFGTVTDRVRVPDAGGDGAGTASPTTAPSSSPTSTRRSPTTSSTVLPTKLTRSPSTAGPGLAFTGADLGPMLVTAFLLLAGGLGFALAGRTEQFGGRRRH